jgi:hypothetical protein
MFQSYGVVVYIQRLFDAGRILHLQTTEESVGTVAPEAALYFEVPSIVKITFI